MRVLGWCLMPNHVHLILVPADERGLRRAVAETHRSHGWRINRRHGWQGHLWQARFHSMPLDDDHLVAAMRYVELNPVRARFVTTPEAWRWSSAAAHIAGRGDELVDAPLPGELARVGPWRRFLADGLAAEAEAVEIRSRQKAGLPLGGSAFVAHLETLVQRPLVPRSVGRPRKEPAHGAAIP